MAVARSADDLDVYRMAFELQKDIFQISSNFPREEMYSLTDQIRRSSRSVGANIREAWAKRRYPAHFISKLTDADGEAEETIHWIVTAHDCGYIAKTEQDALLERYHHISGMLKKMMSNADSWCKNCIAK